MIIRKALLEKLLQFYILLAIVRSEVNINMSENVIIMGESNVSTIDINTDNNSDKICKTKISSREVKSCVSATENIDLTKMDYDDDVLEIVSEDNKMDAKSLDVHGRRGGPNKHLVDESDDDVLEIVNIDDDNSDSAIKSEVIELTDDGSEGWSTANDLYRNTNINLNTGTNQYCASDRYSSDDEPYETAVNKVYIEEEQPDKLVIKGFTFPNSLHALGFGFNKDGKLCQYDKESKQLTDKGYVFDIGTPEYNQAHYEAVGEIVTNHVYKLLIDMGFHKIPFKLAESKCTRDTFIFANKRNLKFTKKLLILIHGSGVVRAGQWARSLIINQSLNHGTQIPYIKEAERLGYDIIITNTNDIRDNSFSPIDHANAVFKKFVIPAKPKTVAIVAHSFGASVTAAMGRNYSRFFAKRVSGIAFTDGVYKIIPDYKFQRVSKNWVSSPLPLNTDIYTSTTDIKRVSAGHIKHEWTSWAAMPAVFAFLEKSYFNFIENMADTMTTPGGITISKQSSKHMHKRKSKLHKEKSASAVPIENVLISDDSDQDISRAEILKEKKRTVELLNQDKSTAALLNQEKSITESSSSQEKSASQLSNQVKPAAEQKKSISEASTEDKLSTESSNQDKSISESSTLDKPTAESSNQEQSASKLSNQVNSTTEQNKSVSQSSTEDKPSAESSNQNRSTVESSNQEKSVSKFSNEVNSTTEQNNSVSESTADSSSQDHSTAESSNQEKLASNMSNQVNLATEQKQSVSDTSTTDKSIADSSSPDKSTVDSSCPDKSTAESTSKTSANLDMEIDGNASD